MRLGLATDDDDDRRRWCEATVRAPPARQLRAASPATPLAGGKPEQQEVGRLLQRRLEGGAAGRGSSADGEGERGRGFDRWVTGEGARGWLRAPRADARSVRGDALPAQIWAGNEPVRARWTVWVAPLGGGAPVRVSARTQTDPRGPNGSCRWRCPERQQIRLLPPRYENVF